MATCDVCGREESMPYKCRHCGGTHCPDHRLPENHDCSGLQNWGDPSPVFDSGFDDSVHSGEDTGRGVRGRVSEAIDRSGLRGYFSNMTYVFLVLIWLTMAAQFVAYFNWSNLGSILAVKGSDGLEAIGFTGIPLLVAFIIIASFVNLIMGSASAKWALLAPIFVPMLMLMGYSPEITQAAYRIGDSYSNILTPLLPYFPLVIVFAQKYDKTAGIGTLIAMMLPYAVAFMLARIPMFIIWIMLGIPLGIEGPIEYPSERGSVQPEEVMLEETYVAREQLADNTLYIESF